MAGLSVGALGALLLVLEVVPAAPPPAPPEEGRPAAPGTGRLVLDTVPAPSLAGNRLGEPARRSVLVYLPPGYDRDPARRYPVLYLLHNWLGSHRQWTDGTFGGFRLDAAMDSLVGGGLAPPMIVVMPDARSGVIGSPYLDSPLTGRWEAFLRRDLVDHVDRRYRTVAEPAARGIAGHSAGGYAALKVAFRHPGVFGAVYGLSPCCLGFGGELGALNVVLAALLAPELEKDGCDGDRWFLNIPLLVLEACPENLARLRGIRFDMGSGDPVEAALPGAETLARALEARGVPHVFERYAGDHMSGVGERMRRRVLPFFAEVLEAQGSMRAPGPAPEEEREAAGASPASQYLQVTVSAPGGAVARMRSTSQGAAIWM